MAKERPQPRLDDQRRLLAWLAPGQEQVLDVAARLAGLRITHLGLAGGGSDRTIAERFGAEPVDDLRHALSAIDADAALVMSTADREEAAIFEEAAVIRAARESGLKILSMEPIPQTLIGALGEKGAAGVFGPRFRRSDGFRAAAEALATFGEVTTIGFSARNGPGQGRLATRLLDAMDTILAALDLPETIDASVRGPRAASGLRLAAGVALRALAGDLTANLRFPDGRSASLILTDRGGRWFRGLTILGEQGCLRVDEDSFEWLDGAGALVDSFRREHDGASDENPAIAGAARAIGDALAELLDPRAGPAPPLDARRALAMAEAALLSARTGQPESPATMLKMAGA